MPLYIKSHSYGEYVFDWSWANAYEQHGRRYYPKLLTAIPFTPSHAARLLIAQGEDADAITAAIAQRVIEEARHLRASSWHVLLCVPSAFSVARMQDNLVALGGQCRCRQLAQTIG